MALVSLLRLYLSHSLSDADVLMAFPELYRYGRERTWFSLKLFTIFMIDGIVQVCQPGLYVPGTDHSFSLSRYFSSSHIHTTPPPHVPTVTVFSSTSTVR